MSFEFKPATRGAIAFVIAFVALGQPARAATLAEALSAYNSNRVSEAERLFEEVVADPAASPTDRAAARRELGRIDWLIRGETDAMAAALAESGDEGRCRMLTVALRVYREAGTPQVALALDQSEPSPEGCTSGEAESLHVERARAHLAQARLSPGNAPSHYAAAAGELGATEAIARRSPSVSSAFLSLALARRDAAGALKAWRDYFWLDDIDAPSAMTNLASRVEAIFRAGLQQAPAESDVAALVEMLIRAGFAEDAALLAFGRDGPRWRATRAYLTFWNALSEELMRANRQMAAGGDAANLQTTMESLMGALMADAGLSGEQRAALLEAYGLYGTDPGTTGGYPSLHLGHVVQDDRMSVEQYGRRGEMRFVVVDNMLANGFLSWLWDGGAHVGGWSADGNLIVQVRSAYTGGPLGDLRRARPGPARDRFEADIERRMADERLALGRDGIAEIPGGGDRLKLQALDQIIARVGDDDSAFIAEIWRATNQTSIEAHEGRHALDDAEKPGRSGPELEYRAKLSQIAFADYPRLGLASLASGAHDETQHGFANRRVLKGYRRWMQRHRGDIAGFDREVPALAQLHLMTDAQIVAAARNLDPWAEKP